MSVAEIDQVAQLRQFQAFALQEFPEIADKTGRALRDTYVRDPARYQRIVQADDIAKQAQWKLAQETQNRRLRENAIAQHQREQEQRRLADQTKIENDKYQDWLKREHPEYATPHGFAKLRGAAPQILKEKGYTDQQIAEAARRGLSAADQRMITEAYWAREARARANEVASKRLPPVSSMAPGVARARGADTEAKIASLRNQLPTLTGRAALDAATRLTKLQRGAR
jgi:hypothetical protein